MLLGIDFALPGDNEVFLSGDKKGLAAIFSLHTVRTLVRRPQGCAGFLSLRSGCPIFWRSTLGPRVAPVRRSPVY